MSEMGAAPAPTAGPVSEGTVSGASDTGTDNKATDSTPNDTELASNGQNGGQKPATEKKRYKVKIDDQEAEVDEDEVVAGYQRAKAAHKRFEEASKLRKQAEQLVHALKNDPISVLTDPRLGVDFKQLAVDYLAKEFEQEEMSPEQRRASELERKVREYEEKEAARIQEAEQAELSQAQQRFAQELEHEFSGVLETSGIPKTTESVRRMAYVKLQAIEAGYDMTAAEIAAEVKRSYAEEHTSYFGALDGDALLSAIGEPTLKKIRKAELARLNGGRNAPSAQRETPNTGSAKEKPKSLDDAIARFLSND